MFDTEELALHKDYSIWNYDYALSFGVEIPTEVIRDLLPAPLSPFEVRPAVSVLAVTVMHFMEGNHNFGRSFTEMTFALNVVSDFARAGRVPRFAMYVLNMGADDTGFAADSYNSDLLPFYPEALEIEVNAEEHRVRCHDEKGNHIFSFESTLENPDYDINEDFFQVFAMHQGELHHGAVTTLGLSYEHQRADHARFEFSNHPIFGGVDVTKVSQPYIQMLAAPSTEARQVYFRLSPMR